MHRSITSPFTRVTAALVLLVIVSACASTAGGRNKIPTGTAQPDQFLYERGTEALQKKKWLTAREFFKQLNEAYTQSPLRPDAKLGIGDTYLGEGSAGTLVQAIAEFQEFLSFYPLNPRADYAQYKLGMAHFRQMRAPQRDQTETREAIREFDTFVARYPRSELLPEVSAKLREARDRLSEADFLIGRFYYKQPWYPGAIDRLSTLLKQDPEYTRRDAVYFYLGEALVKSRREAEALPYYERILAEFEKSEFLEEARRRIAELKGQMERRS
jgi:outer membrane protein assembly factor BamD